MLRLFAFIGFLEECVNLFHDFCYGWLHFNKIQNNISLNPILFCLGT